MQVVHFRPGGQEQVIAYHIAGEILGSEAIGAGAHDASTTALEDSEFWLVPLERIMGATRSEPGAHKQLCKFLSSEIARDRRSMLMLGTMRAEQRLASFLLDLASRYGMSGYSSSEFVLRMTRAEIGLYLGLSVETISRLFSRLRHERLIHVQGRYVKLIDGDGLRRLVDA